jgi:hypothetical protein
MQTILNILASRPVVAILTSWPGRVVTGIIAAPARNVAAFVGGILRAFMRQPDSLGEALISGWVAGFWGTIVGALTRFAVRSATNVA